MDVLSYLIASRLLSSSGGNSTKVDGDGNVITSEDDVSLYVDFNEASLMTDGDIFSVVDSYLIAKVIGSIAESNKKAWIVSML